ncbi:hypothetical protein [Streptomyces sp. NPDC002685]|uniref:hypothetical protein n=1 Tax=Streptomyces sp. NPDC002685 TaxID=3154540 RepID=UPI00331EF393
MSSMKLWVVGVIPDSEARALPDRFAHLYEPWTGERPGYVESLGWWTGGGDREPCFTPCTSGSGDLVATAAAVRLDRLIDDSNVEIASVEAMKDASLSLMPRAVGMGRFAATGRSANPVAALHYALGYESAAKLPGWFGDFLLPAEAVVAALPGVEEALRPTGTRRAEVLSRISDWMAVMGGDRAFDAAELLDGPLRVFQHAADTRSGASAFSRATHGTTRA